MQEECAPQVVFCKTRFFIYHHTHPCSPPHLANCGRCLPRLCTLEPLQSESLVIVVYGDTCSTTTSGTRPSSAITAGFSSGYLTNPRQGRLFQRERNAHGCTIVTAGAAEFQGYCCVRCDAPLPQCSSGSVPAPVADAAITSFTSDK
ncbi:hypothetical protein E2C01_019073 [Portunus trituberculatus]|uniref:Uncharacterized protein n=1 Tax=Portunus trituberculatus TaxID=210409 RepID=A0A5B7DXW8_PORTR|nr:hypothetical protein [Portunus trituberculatus]